MCGITGILSQVPIQDHLIKDAVESLRHRGPDGKGIWCDRHIQLGHTRLAILELSPLGHQPMSYQNERFWITFNGEIYNYLELRQELSSLGHSFISRSDTEVLLAAYAEWGTDCLSRLRGMFAFGIWDCQQNRLFLARDRAGEKPLYYWTDQETLYFASELKTLLALLPNQPELDPIAIDLYLHYQYVPEPRTPLKGVMKLPAAHYLVVDLAEWQVDPQRYWCLTKVEPIVGDVTEMLRHELDQTLNLTLRSDVPIGIALSGGLDSGGIAALAAPKHKDVLQAFSVGYPNHPPCDEREQAKALAQHLGLPFHEVELRTEELVEFFPKLVSLMDDPIADIAAYSHFAVMQLSANHGIKVVLSGIGGDELFWGYDWVVNAMQLAERKQQLGVNSAEPAWLYAGLERLTLFPLYDKFAVSPKMPVAVRSALQQGLAISQMAPHRPEQAVFYNVRTDFRQSLYHRRALYTREFQQCLSDRSPFQPFIIDVDQQPEQTCQLLFETWLVSNCLSLSDRTSMAASLEVRLPLLDHKLIELVMGLRKQQPDHHLERKSWLKKALRNTLPDEVIDRPKRGFEPPYAEWIKELLAVYQEQLINGYFVKLGYFSREYVVKLCRNVQENYAIVYRLIVLELWYRTVVIKEGL